MLLGSQQRGPGKGHGRLSCQGSLQSASCLVDEAVENGLRFRRIANELIDNKNQLDQTLCSYMGQGIVLMYVFPSTKSDSNNYRYSCILTLYSYIAYSSSPR
jgi:hypothetical protein